MKYDIRHEKLAVFTSAWECEHENCTHIHIFSSVDIGGKYMKSDPKLDMATSNLFQG